MTTTSQVFYSLCLVLAVRNAYAVSKLAPLYEALSNKNQTLAESMSVNLAQAIPSEEIPVIDRALHGDGRLRNAALSDAISMVRTHEEAAKQRGESNNSILELKTEFKVLVPIVSARFNDFEPDDIGSKVKDGRGNDAWKTLVVRFMDTIGASPTSDMVGWMLEVLQSPQRAGESWVTQVESTSISDAAQLRLGHEGFLRGAIEHFRSVALDVAPVLSHLTPMLVRVGDVLTGIINDKTEPELGATIITALSSNVAEGPSFVDLMAARALDRETPTGVRVASIFALVKLKPADRIRLAELREDQDDAVKRAVHDVGIR